MAKMLSIKEIKNNNWLLLEDGNWCHFVVTDEGAVYIDGQDVSCNIRNWGFSKKEEIFDPIENRFEILDL